MKSKREILLYIQKEIIRASEKLSQTLKAFAYGLTPRFVLSIAASLIYLVPTTFFQDRYPN